MQNFSNFRFNQSNLKNFTNFSVYLSFEIFILVFLASQPKLTLQMF